MDELKPALDAWIDRFGWPIDLDILPAERVIAQLVTKATDEAERSTYLGMAVMIVRPQDWVSSNDLQERVAADRIAEGISDLITGIRHSQDDAGSHLVVLFCPPDEGHAQDGELVKAGHLAEKRTFSALGSHPNVTVIPSRDWIQDAQAVERGIDPNEPDFAQRMASAVARQIFLHWRPPLEVLAVDAALLWESQDQFQSVSVPAAHGALQSRLKQLSDSGVLVCVLSNTSVESLRQAVAGDEASTLGEEEIVSWVEVRWNVADEISRIAGVLGVSIESLCYLSGSEEDAGKVMKAHPQVGVIQVPEALEERETFLQHCWLLDVVNGHAPSAKALAVRQRGTVKRRLARRAASTYDIFLKELDLKVDQVSPTSEHHPRMAELARETSRFNATSRLFTVAEVKEWLGRPYHYAVLFRARDRFGDHGLVGMVMYERVKCTLLVHNFVLCGRALGFGVEHQMLAALGTIATHHDCQDIDLPFLQTDENKAIAEFLKATVGACRQELPEEGWCVHQIPIEVAKDVRHQKPTESSAFSAEVPPSVASSTVPAPSDLLRGIAKAQGSLPEREPSPSPADEATPPANSPFQIASPSAASQETDGGNEKAPLLETEDQADDEKKEEASGLTLTPMQVWHLQTPQANRDHCSETRLFQVTDSLNEMALERAVNWLAKRHESLRMQYHSSFQGWRQEGRFLPNNDLVSVVDLSDIEESDVDGHLVAAAEVTQGRLSLSQGILFRAVHFQLGQRPGRLLFVAHQLAVDERSWEILIRDFEVAYQAYLSGEEPQMAAAKSFVTWWQTQESLSTDEEPDAVQKAYWKALGDRTAMARWLEGRGNGENTCGFEQIRREQLSAVHTGLLFDAAQESGETSLESILIAALALTGRELLSSATVNVDVRRSVRASEVEAIVGLFERDLPLEINLPLDLGLSESLEQVLSQLRDHGQVAQAFALANEPERESRCQLRFHYQGNVDTAGEQGLLNRRLTPSLPREHAENERTHELDLVARVADGVLEWCWLYSNRLYTDEAIDQLAKPFRVWLDKLVQHFEMPDVAPEGSSAEPEPPEVEEKRPVPPRAAFVPQIDAFEPPRLVLLSAPNEKSLAHYRQTLGERLATDQEVGLDELAYTLATDRSLHETRWSTVASDREEAVKCIQAPDVPGGKDGRLGQRMVFLFPGSGLERSQFTAGIYQSEPAFKEVVDWCSDVLSQMLHVDLRQVLYGETDREIHENGRYVDPALFVTEFALARLWMSWGIYPEAVFGVGVGEYVAACLAGVFTLEEGLALVAKRAALMDSLEDRSAQLLVKKSEREVKPFLMQQVDVLVVNDREEVIVGGPAEDIEDLVRVLQNQGMSFQRFTTNHALPGPAMRSVVDPLAKVMEMVDLQPPQIPLLSSARGRWLTTEEAQDPNYWAHLVRLPVNVYQSWQALLEGSDVSLLECGPGETLIALARRHAMSSKATFVASSLGNAQSGPDEATALLATAGRLWESGAVIDWHAFYRHRPKRLISLPEPELTSPEETVVPNEEKAPSGGGEAEEDLASATLSMQAIADLALDDSEIVESPEVEEGLIDHEGLVKERLALAKEALDRLGEAILPDAASEQVSRENLDAILDHSPLTENFDTHSRDDLADRLTGVLGLHREDPQGLVFAACEAILSSLNEIRSEVEEKVPTQTAQTEELSVEPQEEPLAKSVAAVEALLPHEPEESEEEAPPRDGQRDYWLERLSELPQDLSLPYDFPPGKPRREMILSRQLAPTLWSKVEGGADERLVKVRLIAAYAILLARLSKQDDVVIAVEFSGRPLPWRIRYDRDLTISAYLEAVEYSLREVEAQADVSPESLTEMLGTAVIRAAFVAEEGGEALKTISRSVEINLSLGQHPRELCCVYNAAVLDEQTVSRWLDCLELLLTQLLEEEDADCVLKQLSLLTDRDRQELLVTRNQSTTGATPEATIPQIFEMIAAKSPAKIALRFGDEQMNYGHLNRHANQMAHYLRDLKVSAGAPVAVCMERSLVSVTSTVAVLKAGAACALVDPQDGDARLRHLFKDLLPTVVLTQSHLVGRVQSLLPETSTIIEMDQPLPDRYESAIENPAVPRTPNDSAMIHYVNDRAEEAVGVMIPHRAIVRLVKNADYVTLGPSDIFLHHAPMSSHVVAFEIWGPLLNGGTLAIAASGGDTCEEFARAIRRFRVTFAAMATPRFEQMLEHHSEHLQGLRQLMIHGQEPSMDKVRKAYEELFCQLIYGSGPEENGVFTCCHAITEADLKNDALPLGLPVPNTHVYVLDRDCQVLPLGVTGDLYVGGDGLATGYWNREALTQERFVRHENADIPDEILFKTDESCRWRADGVLERVTIPKPILSSEDPFTSTAALELTALRIHGMKAPLICLCQGVTDEVLCHRLEQELIKDRPLYRLEVPDQAPSLTALASQCLAKIRDVIGDGPLVVVGGPFGGLLAYEVAQHAFGEGSPVEMLALFDTANPASEFVNVDQVHPLAQRYVPEVYLGSMVLFRSVALADGQSRPSQLGWEGLVRGGLSVISMDSFSDTSLIQSFQRLLDADQVLDTSS